MHLSPTSRSIPAKQGHIAYYSNLYTRLESWVGIWVGILSAKDLIARVDFPFSAKLEYHRAL